MKKMIMKLTTKFGGVLAMMAMLVAVTSSSRVCAFIAHQPQVPDEVKRLRKF